MRGEDRTIGALFSYVDIEARIPPRHPLRAMRRLTVASEDRRGRVERPKVQLVCGHLRQRVIQSAVGFRRLTVTVSLSSVSVEDGLVESNDGASRLNNWAIEAEMP